MVTKSFNVNFDAVGAQCEVDALLLLGHAIRVQGDTNRAAEKYKQAELLAQESTKVLHKSSQIIAIIYQQICLYTVGRSQEALKSLNSLLSNGSTDKSTKRLLFYALGCVYRTMSEFEKAGMNLNTSIQVAEADGDYVGVSEGKAELGRVYRATGQFGLAYDCQMSLFHFALSRGDVSGVAAACSLIEFTCQYLKSSEAEACPDFAKSIQYLAVGMQLSQFLEAKNDVGWCLNNIAKAYIKMKCFEPALKLCKERLKIAIETGNVVGEGTAYGNAGIACRGAGKFQEALHYHKSYLEMVQKPLDKAWMENQLALDCLAMGDIDNALCYALRELCTSNSIRSRYSIMADKQKIANFDKNHARCFNLLQYILVKQGNPEATLVLADMGRARAVADLIHQKSSSKPTEHFSLDKVLLGDGRLNVTYISHALRGMHHLISKLQTSLVFYSVIESPLPEIDTQPWLYTWLLSPTTCSVKFLEYPLKAEDSTGFDTLIGMEEDYFTKILLQKRPGGDCAKSRDIVLVQDQPEVAKSTTTSGPQQKLSQGSIIEEVNEKLTYLYDLLISPIEPYFDSGKVQRIVFVPHAFLLNVPYSALHSQKGYLIERFIVSTSPSVHLLELGLTNLRTAPTVEGLSILAVGNPTMPQREIKQLRGAFEEARMVAETFSQAKSAVVLCEHSATKLAVCQHLSKCHIVHLATHAILGDTLEDLTSAYPHDTPYGDYTTKGSIILAKSSESCSEILTSSEIQEANISAELVVLSCCKMAHGKLTHDGILGLSRAFLIGGASAVIVTLWSIEDSIMSEFMNHFCQATPPHTRQRTWLLGRILSYWSHSLPFVTSLVPIQNRNFRMGPVWERG